MKKQSSFFLMLVTIGMFMVSCSKSEDKSRTDLLAGKTQKIWKFSAATIDPPLPISGTTVTDLYAQWSSTYKDNLLVFKSNNTYNWEEGLTKDSPSDPDVFETGSWTFNSTETIINMTPSQNSIYELNIVSISEEELVASLTESYNSLNYVITYHFKPM